MKSISKLLIVLILGMAMLIPSPATGESAHRTFSGLLGSEEYFDSFRFTDVLGDNLYKATGYAVTGILPNYGSNSFRSSDALTRGEALTSILVFMGLRDEIQDLWETNIPRDIPVGERVYSEKELYELSVVALATRAGILRNTDLARIENLDQASAGRITTSTNAFMERYNNANIPANQLNALRNHATRMFTYRETYDQPIERQELLLYISRALNLDRVNDYEHGMWSKYLDSEEFYLSIIPEIETALSKGYLSSTANSFDPRGSIERSEYLAVLDRLSREMLPNTGLNKHIGVINKITTSRSTLDGYAYQETTYSVTTEWGENIALRVSSGLGLEDIVVIKDGVYGGSTLLAEGDQIEFYTESSSRVLYVEARALSLIKGTLISIAPNSVSFDFGFGPTSLPINNATSIFLNGVSVPASSLERGQELRLYIRNGIIERISARAYTVIGRVLSLSDDGLLTVEDYSGNIHKRTLKDQSRIMTNDRLGRIDDIAFDVEVKLHGNDKDEILILEIYYPILSPGYITPGTRLIYGVVDYVDRGIIEIRGSNGASSVYSIGNNTLIEKGARIITIDSIKRGDRVKLSFDDLYTNTPSNIKVSLRDGVIANIYKGTLESVFERNRELVVKDISKYYHSEWERVSPLSRLAYASNVELYYGDRVISARDMSRYRGMDMYLVTENRYGNETVIKALISEGNERSYYDNIAGITWTQSLLNMELGYNIRFHNGTIVIKDGRLLDSSFMTEEAAFIVTSRVGNSQIANIVSLENPTGFSEMRIDRGWLVGVGNDAIRIDGIGSLINNSMSYRDTFNKSKMLYTNNNTLVMDNVVEEKVIPYSRLASSQFYPFTYTHHEYIDNGDFAHGPHNVTEHYHEYYTYVPGSGTRVPTASIHSHILSYVVRDNDDNIIAINLWEWDKRLGNRDATFGEAYSTGVVDSINSTLEFITLRGVRNFSPFFGSWQLSLAPLSIDASKAIFVRDGRAISFKDISLGDSVYVLRIGSNGVVIIVNG